MISIPADCGIFGPKRVYGDRASEHPESYAHATEEAPFVVSMLAGASAGVAARLPCHPIDTILAKLQVVNVQ